MGRVTQYMDYLTRDPNDFWKEIQSEVYTHFTINEEAKKVRRRLRLYRPQEANLLF